MVTNCVPVTTFPELSVTVQVTVVVPIGKDAGALFVTEATPHSSVTVGVPRLIPVAPQPELADAMMFAGTTKTGGL